MKLRLLNLCVLLLLTFYAKSQSELFEKPESRAKKVVKTDPKYKNLRDEQGRRQGYWMRFHPNGNPAYRARFKDDIPVDTLIRYYKNGEKFVEIVFDNNNRLGRARFFSEKGKLIATGFYNNMKKDSIWEFFDERGRLRSRETFENDLQQGLSEIFYDSGTLAAEVLYWEGKKQGLEKQYYPDGSPRVYINYKDGKFDGAYTVYYPDGKHEITGYYKDGKQDSLWIFYDALGREKFSLMYKDGVAVNKDKLDSLQRQEYNLYEQNKERFEDPEKYMNNPDELIRNF
ncbi:toxin-antitoxin system YwqK family antitoxin [Thermophagus xiamenensis]|uniref:Antitoxin component YwqK of the YwqJK toxin-antitoxin module n=1 Tax=Thermophagus xiamenensis TaxID=385682 RepID=A0A1I1VMX3_9BACT|nr:toxin-antitoxin system YwqK family antitoxin [Thermophagus xiamenensis]SFD81920.1 Antitoxin component YwqK of the YwqJK toxin-antitoxin module [Thermophagus xiamenensis]